MIVRTSTLARPVYFAICLVCASCVTGCSGGSTAGSNSGGGGSGTGGSGGNSVGPTSGLYLWEAGGSDYNLSYATINATTGAVSSPTVASSPVSNPASYPSLVVAPSRKFLYAFFAALSKLETFQLSGPGLQAKLLADADHTKEISFGQSLLMHPSGKFLYVVESGSKATIQVFALNSDTGALTPGSAVSEDADLRVAILDPSARFLLVNDLTGSRIFVYQVNQSDGSLTPVPNSPFKLPAGDLPLQVALGPSAGSHFLYSSLSSGDIEGFSLDSSTGALMLLPGSPFQPGGASFAYLCVDPSGKLLYGSESLTGAVAGFAIDQTTGELSPIPGSPFAAAAPAGMIATDPSGKFLYETNYKDSKLYAFSVDPATGALIPIAGSPFVSVLQPQSVTMMSIP